MSLRMTPSQTVGPFFDLGLASLYVADMTSEATRGQRIVIRGRLLDGDAAPIPDAVLEIWQADSAGQHPDSSGFGRVATTADGEFSVRTIKPGPVDDQAPHLCVQIFMRGLLKPVHTRMYFPDDPKLAQDPILTLVPPARRATLIARRTSEADLQWNIRMQGEDETVFFEF
jgi:protocatechuate 3,4-dioxygenase alpha subunit